MKRRKQAHKRTMNTVAPNSKEMSADESLALDHALGILLEPHLGLARKRLGEDASFARLVSRYRTLLGPAPVVDDGLPPIAPRPGTWDAILAEITSQRRC